MTNIYEITNLFLYGQKTKPALVTDARIRPDNVASPSISISTDGFMDSGAGRFAKAPMFDWIRNFFNDGTILPGEYSKQQIAQGIYGLNYYGWNMQHYDWKDGTDDYAERVYIYNSMSFKVFDAAKFVVEANGTKIH
jgi:hypothetical protein